APVGGVDLAQVLGGCRKDQRTGNRIAGDAAAKAVDLAGQLFFAPFAHEVDRSEDAPAFARAAILLLVAHAGEQPAVGGLDLDLAADLARLLDCRIGVIHAFVEPLRVDRDLRAGAGDLED